ncbi:MAG: SRPBCC family protein [Pseudomonadota bacterium]
MRSLAAITVLGVCAVSVSASDLRKVDVDRVDGVYTMHSVVWFDADIHSVYSVFLDWDLSEQFSSVVVEARNTGSDATGDRGFYTRNRACVLFYCKSVERQGSVEHEPLRFIRATTDPERSDFHVSDELWLFEKEGEGTLITYTLEMQPKFWIPPVIGPYVLKRKMRKDGTAALDRIELIAQQWTPDEE